MQAQVSEHVLVVNQIKRSLSSQYNVMTNVDEDLHYVASLFPDLIVQDKTTLKTLFIIEVKKNGNIAQCIQQWKNIPNIPATLYIIVPESDLQNAKTIAQVVGLKTRFGSYKIEGENVTVQYE